ncbi:unnamed protein product (mitochondrion) [Plasmodiophora brassicae]|uniref:Uncharacterized protein n=1 Tax=Plasmodiophora brassicae TaxID=37360 RepID=A0A0G4IQR6_PLABS|nr:hypothetical protein PBRA_005816 [Plasmodiophora brassicae]SPQ98246.1 unnamed protein product [Plasmodiophora brassicae]
MEARSPIQPVVLVQRKRGRSSWQVLLVRIHPLSQSPQRPSDHQPAPRQSQPLQRIQVQFRLRPLLRRTF